jgi:hypothetical protein
MDTMFDGQRLTERRAGRLLLDNEWKEDYLF